MTEETGLAKVEQTIAERQAVAMNAGPLAMRDDGDLFGNFGDRTLRESHGFHGDPKNAWRQIALAGADDVKDISDVLDTPMAISNYYVHEADLRPDVNGQIPRVIRTVLYTPHGDRFATTSEGIARDVYRITRMYGNAPWSPPLVVKAISIKTGSGFKIFRLIPADAVITEGQKK